MLLPHPARTMADTAIPSTSAVLTAVGVGNSSLLYVDVLVRMYKFQNILLEKGRPVMPRSIYLQKITIFYFHNVRTRLLENLY